MTVKTICLVPFLLGAVLLTGCQVGPNANTTIQDETGSGIVLAAGSMTVASVVVVAGDDGGQGAVSAVLVNEGSGPEQLLGITVAGREAVIEPADQEIVQLSSLSIRPGGDLTATVPLGSKKAGEFVEVRFLFTESGAATGDVLIVPAEGAYAAVAPGQPSAEPAAPLGPTSGPTE